MDKAVIGLGFGDEGKGRVVDYLCSLFNPSLVIRFSGGQQAGHQVITDDCRHVFSNFGSGTLQGVPTYWSKYCTIDPVGILNELDVLLEKGIKPTLYIDERCPVTTPHDKIKNKRLDAVNRHGSCGVGVGQTYQREEDFYSLLFADLFFPSVLEEKYFLIAKSYYGNLTTINFLSDCAELVKSEHVKITYGIPDHLKYKNDYIFEGSQGLLLDQNIGFFPHVSRGNFGSKNILDMGNKPEIFLVTRAYQTRHGNGPMTNEGLDYDIKENPYEQNPDDNIQGKFRRTMLDLDLLKYAILRDEYIRQVENKTLIITCLDLIDEYIFTVNGKVENCLDEEAFIKRIKFHFYFLGVSDVYVSRSPLTKEIEIFN